MKIRHKKALGWILGIIFAACMIGCILFAVLLIEGSRVNSYRVPEEVKKEPQFLKKLDSALQPPRFNRNGEILRRHDGAPSEKTLTTVTRLNLAYQGIIDQVWNHDFTEALIKAREERRRLKLSPRDTAITPAEEEFLNAAKDLPERLDQLLRESQAAPEAGRLSALAQHAPHTYWITYLISKARWHLHHHNYPQARDCYRTIYELTSLFRPEASNSSQYAFIRGEVNEDISSLNYSEHVAK